MNSLMNFIPENINYRYNEGQNKFETKFNDDLQLLIIWSKARVEEKRILEDLFLNFKVLSCVETTWSKECEDDNFHRLYNVAPTGGIAGKKMDVGSGSFIVVILKDENPIYQYRSDASGRFKIVNSNIVDRKNLYRNWVGGSYMVHSTDNLNEFFNNSMLFFGKAQTFKFFSQRKQNQKIESANNDLIGARGWANVQELFDVLNLSTQYVVLRGANNIEENVKELAGDIDILCSDIGEFTAVANARNIWNSSNFFHVKIEGKDILFDIRYVGDNYFDKTWQQNIIENRILTENRIYIPRVDDYFFSHLYHAYIHKPFFYEKYIDRLTELSEKIGIKNFKDDCQNNTDNILKLLRGYLLAHNYQVSIPKDEQVYINIKFVSKLQKVNRARLFLRILSIKVKDLPTKVILKTKILIKKNKILFDFMFALRATFNKYIRNWNR